MGAALQRVAEAGFGKNNSHQELERFILGNDHTSVIPTSLIFDNRKGFLRPHEVATALGISVKTVYDWKHRPWRRKTPEGLFVKFNGQLLIRIELLDRWISTQSTRSR